MKFINKLNYEEIGKIISGLGYTMVGDIIPVKDKFIAIPCKTHTSTAEERIYSELSKYSASPLIHYISRSAYGINNTILTMDDFTCQDMLHEKDLTELFQNLMGKKFGDSYLKAVKINNIGDREM